MTDTNTKPKATPKPDLAQIEKVLDYMAERPMMGAAPMAEELKTKFKAKIQTAKSTDMIKVTIGRVEGRSTGGLALAIGNWSNAARRALKDATDA